MRRRLLMLTPLAMAAFAPSRARATADAASWPARPVRLVEPCPPGSAEVTRWGEAVRAAGVRPD